jgi:hypothetical protein
MVTNIENTTYAHIRALAIRNEGIVIMDCAGSKLKWIRDVTNDLIKSGLLKYGTKLEDVWHNPIYVFRAPYDDNKTDMLFLWKPNGKLDISKLIEWRLRNGSSVKWLTDYTDGRFENRCD